MCLSGHPCACLATQALQEALKVECSPLPEDRLGGPETGCGHEDMRTEMEVLKQQVRGCGGVSTWRGGPGVQGLAPSGTCESPLFSVPGRISSCQSFPTESGTRHLRLCAEGPSVGWAQRLVPGHTTTLLARCCELQGGLPYSADSINRISGQLISDNGSGWAAVCSFRLPAF